VVIICNLSLFCRIDARFAPGNPFPDHSNASAAHGLRQAGAGGYREEGRIGGGEPGDTGEEPGRGTGGEPGHPQLSKGNRDTHNSDFSDSWTSSNPTCRWRQIGDTEA